MQRSLILQAVQSMHTHPTSAEVYEEVRKSHPSISRATVYRNLSVLTESGAITRVKVPGGADRYDSRCDAHYHGVCRECGAVCDVEIPVNDEVFRHVDSQGFKVESCSVTFSGLCPDCAAKHHEKASDYECEQHHKYEYDYELNEHNHK